MADVKSQLGLADECTCSVTLSSSPRGVIPPLQLSLSWNLSATLWEPREGGRDAGATQRSGNRPQAAPSPRSARAAAGVPLPRAGVPPVLPPRPSRDLRREGALKAAVAHPSAARHYLSAALPARSPAPALPLRAAQVRDAPGGPRRS